MRKDKMRERDISPEELKQLQLSILDEVDAFCRASDIKYFLMFGTLLGAVRHKGYIPWDDDIDIGMLRADYDRFIETFVSQNGDLDIECYEKNPSCIYPFAKVYNTNTVFYDTTEKNALGVNIDVFPIDFLPEDEKKRKKLLSCVRTIRRMITLMYLKTDRTRSLLKNMVIIAGRVLRLIPKKALATAMDKYQRSIVESKYVGFLTGNDGHVIYDVAYFDRVIELAFERKKYLAPQEYDKILSQEYGDYMKLPPIDKRISHHDFVAYWKDCDRTDQH